MPRRFPLHRHLLLIPTIQLFLATAALAAPPGGLPTHPVHVKDGVVLPGPADETDADQLRYAPGKVIVKLKEGSSIQELDRHKIKHKLKIKEKKLVNTEHERFKNLHVIRAADDANLQSLAAELMENPAVEYAEPVSLSTAQLTPTDPLYPQQWSHRNAKAEAGWDITTGSSSVVIAIIDTGVDYNHPDLAANIWRDGSGNPGKDFVDVVTSAYTSSGYTTIASEDYTTADSDPKDYFGHGTHAAGIAAGISNNGVGISGVCPSCKIMPVRAGFTLRKSGTDYAFFESDDLANAIIYAADNGAKVINISAGGSYSTLVDDAVSYAESRGVVLIAAAGNNNTSSTTNAYPAALSKVLAVAATGNSDTRAPYSNYGFWVDVAAPGGDGSYSILSTVPTVGSYSDASGYKGISGTSMASAYVSGLAGLILSKNPSLTNRQVLAGIKQGADVYNQDLANSTDYIGVGRVNVTKSLSATSYTSASATLSAPADSFMAGSGLQFTGSATAPYKVFYGAGIYPSSWIQIASGPATSGVLATLDAAVATSTVEQATIKVVAQDQNGAVETLVHGTVGKQFLPGWSKNFSLTTKSTVLYSALNLADIDKDGMDEILISGYDPTGKVMVNVFKHDGRQAAGWPQTFSGSLNVEFGPAVGDVDGDGNLEVALPTKLNDSLNLWDRSGNLLWSKVLEYDTPILNVTFGDLNGDGKDQIITQAYNSKLYVLDGQGNTLWTYAPGEYDSWHKFKTVAVADLDGDGKKEIVKNVLKTIRLNAGDLYRTMGGSVVVLNNDGTVRWHYDWPEAGENVSLTKYYTFYPVGSPLVADINNDGSPDILVKVRVWRADDTGTATEINTRFYAFDSNGAVLPGWPVIYPGFPSAGEMAVGDLNLDGRKVLVGGTFDRLLAIKYDGSLIFPPVAVSQQGNISIADVSGDGRPDIVAYDGTYFQIVQGGLVSTLPITAKNSLNNKVNNSPILTDLNHSGSEKLIFFDGDNTSLLWAWDLQVPHVAAAEQWTLNGFDSGHSGVSGSPSLSQVSIATSSLPDAMAGVSYSQALTANGGKPPYTWAVTKGSLLSGLTLNSATGTLSGTPGPGTTTFTVRAVDSSAATATRTLTLTSTGTLQPIKTTGSSTRYFSLLQDAYNGCADGDTIQLQGGLFAESPRFDRDIIVHLSGGYDGTFTAKSGVSRINGCLAIRFGKVTADGVTLK